MKFYRRITLATVATITGLSSLFLSATPVHASPGNIYFSPAGGRFDPGSNFSIEVRTTVANPGTFAGGATIGVTYPTNMVQMISTSTSGGAFGGSTSSGVGLVNYSSFTISPRYGNNLLIFRINFKAIATGNVTLNFTTNSEVNSGPTTKQSSTFSIQPASCPAGQVGTPPSCSTPAPPPKPVPQPAPSPTPKPTPTPSPSPSSPAQSVPEPSPDSSTEVIPEQVDAGDLSISDVTAKSSWTDSTISWRNSLPDASSSIEIGTKKDTLLPGPDVAIKNDGTFSTTIPDLEPGVRYYYLVTAVSPLDPAKKATYSGALTTRGFPTVLEVMQNETPVQGAKISIDNGSYTTSEAGSVMLELANKTYSAIITDKENTSNTVTFAVKKKTIPTNGSSPERQTFSFSIAKKTPPSTGIPFGLLLGSIIGGVILIGSFFLFLLYRRHRNEELSVPTTINDGYSWTQTPQPPVIQTEALSDNTMTEEQQYSKEPVVAQQSEYPLEQQIIEPSLNESDRPTDTLNEQYISPQEELSLPQNSEIPPEQPLSIGTNESTASEQPLSTDTQKTQEIVEISESDTTIPSIDPPSPETGAIYDPSTGELDIIHHAKAPARHGGLG